MGIVILCPFSINMDIKKAINIIGGDIWCTTKMPGFSVGLPTSACITGTKLHKVPNTVCKSCYAMRGNYTYNVVINAQTRRLNALNHLQWVEAFVTVLSDKYNRYIKNVK